MRGELRQGVGMNAGEAPSAERKRFARFLFPGLTPWAKAPLGKNRRATLPSLRSGMRFNCRPIQLTSDV
jgi:hypothetical protein